MLSFQVPQHSLLLGIPLLYLDFSLGLSQIYQFILSLIRRVLPFLILILFSFLSSLYHLSEVSTCRLLSNALKPLGVEYKDWVIWNLLTQISTVTLNLSFSIHLLALFLIMVWQLHCTSCLTVSRLKASISLCLEDLPLNVSFYCCLALIMSPSLYLFYDILVRLFEYLCHAPLFWCTNPLIQLPISFAASFFQWFVFLIWFHLTKLPIPLPYVSYFFPMSSFILVSFMNRVQVDWFH